MEPPPGLPFNLSLPLVTPTVCCNQGLGCRDGSGVVGDEAGGEAPVQPWGGIELLG